MGGERGGGAGYAVPDCVYVGDDAGAAGGGAYAPECAGDAGADRAGDGEIPEVERLVHPLRFLHCLPLSHVFGQFMGLWCPALLGAEAHFADELEPGWVVELIKRERITCWWRCRGCWSCCG